ncbi:hypothetical protein DFH06DRAFT_1389050 [Mycena polygramma]|nr:hypothetical protein DFH06DRAFT_1389050 [Mycena polygramma]
MQEGPPSLSPDEPPPNPFAKTENQIPAIGRVAITGPRGAGKSAFGRYLLSLRCMLGLPTICVEGDLNRLTFYNGNEVSEHPFSWDVVCAFPQNSWYIIDYGQSRKVVPDMFQKVKGFVVQITHEGTSWMERSIPAPVLLAINGFSAEELIAVRDVQTFPGTLRIKAEDLRHFVDLYGGCAWDAFGHASNPARYAARLKRELTQITPADVHLLVRGEKLPNFFESRVSHSILSPIPYRTDNGLREVTLAAPTLHVQQLLMRQMEAGHIPSKINEFWRGLLASYMGRSLATTLLDLNLKHGRVCVPFEMKLQPPHQLTGQVETRMAVMFECPGPATITLRNLTHYDGHPTFHKKEIAALPPHLHYYHQTDPVQSRPKALILQSRIPGFHPNLDTCSDS